MYAAVSNDFLKSHCYLAPHRIHPCPRGLDEATLRVKAVTREWVRLGSTSVILFLVLSFVRGIFCAGQTATQEQTPLGGICMNGRDLHPL
jgi:hypothetical protein